jgi:two-component system, LytTR family, response regulator
MLENICSANQSSHLSVDIKEQLSASFARVHNSYIVDIARLKSIRDNQVFVGGKQIPISEKFREVFVNRIKERAF